MALGPGTISLLDSSGLRGMTLKPIKFQVQEVIQDRPENHSLFIQLVIQTLLQHTNLDSETPDGQQFLVTSLPSPTQT